MKVLMLGWELPPYNSGGLGIACYQLCKALSAQQTDIEFILPFRHDETVPFMTVTSVYPNVLPGDYAAVEAYDSHLYKLSEDDTARITVSLVEQQEVYEKKVNKLVQYGSYDIIHAHDWLTFRAGLKAKQQTGSPLVVHVHSIERDRAGGNDGNPYVREIEQTGLLLADHIVAVSEHTKRCIIADYNVPANKIEVVHNSIDTSVMEPLDLTNAYRYLEVMKQDGYCVVASVSRLTTQKGLPVLLRAAQAVIRRQPKTLFLVVGSGEQYFELIELAADLGISKNVLFTGFQRGKNWRDAYAIADVFVMPSVSEPFGLTPLEAISYGTPSIISRQSGVSEVISNCLKVDHWDVQELANKITAVVQNDSLRYELHANSYQEFKRLSWDQAASRLRCLYEAKLAEVTV